QLPANLDPLKADLSDDLERQRLARLLQRGLNTATGYVLPLGRDDLGERWRSCSWEMRRGALVLIPGDAPLGFRLPLNSLP
ncbi:transglutaminase family protein, partial [Microbulbifer sp. OS29]